MQRFAARVGTEVSGPGDHGERGSGKHVGPSTGKNGYTEVMAGREHSKEKVKEEVV